METTRFIHYEEDRLRVGWLEGFPDCRTQGETLEELMENLKDVCRDLSGGHIPCVHRMGELVVP